MLTYVYMGSVGPFENVYVNKKYFSTFEFWRFFIGIFFVTNKGQ